MQTAQQIEIQAPILERILTTARDSGSPADQVQNFIGYGYAPLPKSWRFHAAARAADLPNGPVEIAFGGARGPGKSHTVFAQVALDDCQRVDGLNVLFLRRVGVAAKESFEQLRDKVVRGRPHLFIKQPMQVRFPNGSRVVVGNFRNDADIDKYLGLEYDIIVIEEATQLPELTLKKILGSLRSTKPEWRPRLYLTTNPGGVGHQWFKKRYVIPFRRGELGRTHFIPANYQDNPFLNAEYVLYLEGLTGVLGRMWRDGDWDVGQGQYFTTFDYDKHVIKPFEIPHEWPVWIGFDYGFTHNTAVTWHTVSRDGEYYTIAEHGAPRWLPRQHAQEIKRISAQLHRPVRGMKILAGHDCFTQRGDSRAQTIAQQYKQFGIVLTRANVARIPGAANMLRLLGNPETKDPIRWRIFETCPRLIDTIPAMLSNPNRPEDVLKVDADMEGNHGDDFYDSARYGLHVSNKTNRARSYSLRRLR